KVVLVYDLTTGEKIKNVISCNVTREYGDVVFQPKTVPGRYAIYYMPYRQPGKTSGTWNGSYLPARVTADPAWMARHGLNVSAVENTIRPVGALKTNADSALGASFEVISGSAAKFAGNDYKMTYEVRFPQHVGPFVTPTLLLREDGRGYQTTVYDLNGQLMMSVGRKDSKETPYVNAKDTHKLVEANLKSPWPVNMDRPLRATVTVKVLADKTVITSQVQGTGDDRRPFTTPLLTAEDTSPQRISGGASPACRLYPGDNRAGVWVRNIVITNGNGKVVFDSRTARRGRSVENIATLADAKLDGLPQAKLVKMESRRRGGKRPNMDSFFPMEIIASEKELSELLARNADAVLLFPEDRRRPIVMPDFVPRKWALHGPQDTFSGKCRPNEYYCWQIGVHAAKEDIRGLTLEYSDMKNAAGKVVIQSDDITCFNLEGTDIRGNDFTKDFALGKGMVRPLWIGMMVPDDALGDLRGEVKVRVNDRFTKTIRFQLTVDGPIIPSHGDDEPWRHSRLRWLNSTLGLDDNLLPPPFTAVKRQGATIEILNRTLHLNHLGLPEKITSSGIDVLASPVRIDVLGAAGRPLVFKRAENKVLKENPSRVIQTARTASGKVTMSVRGELWFDGAINYDLTLRGETEVALKDVAVVIPMRKELAKYFIGFSHRGDRRPGTWQWKWDRRYQDNAAWLGDVKAGMGIKLLGEKDYWDLSGLRWEEHRQWINEAMGGASLSEDGDTVVLRAFTGAKTLKAGEPLKLRFRLYVTPFKPLRPDHWNLRFFDNIVHYHHSTRVNPYINYPFMTVDAMRKTFADLKTKGSRGMTIYYTLRELSNIAPELFAFRSLGEEIVKSTGAFVYSTSGSSIQGEGGGHPWLREHLVSGYSPAWQQTVHGGDIDAAMAINGDGRLVNYYIEGLAWLQKKIGFVGVYLDGIGYDRIGMMRLARALSAGGSDYYLPFHSGDNFKNPWSEHRASPITGYMEHLPFVTQLMFGEVFWYDGPEGYWMTNLAGLPFGIDNQFYPVPGPDYPFRVMLYASSENVGRYAADIRAFWDRWGLNEQTKTLGYWDPNCPVKTSARDVFASVYTNDGKALICIGSWAADTTPLTLSVDWHALGMDPAKVRITVPDIGSVQKPQKTFDIARPISIEPGKGIVIGIEKN
ncbi:MAG: DUF6067 family protein, partial [Planctomycetota bacterium]|nr:DUF6067 family protein [Planctomycetota bacterium]